MKELNIGDKFVYIPTNEEFTVIRKVRLSPNECEYEFEYYNYFTNSTSTSKNTHPDAKIDNYLTNNIWKITSQYESKDFSTMKFTPTSQSSCTCGSHKTYGTSCQLWLHSSWCDLRNEKKEVKETFSADDIPF